VDAEPNNHFLVAVVVPDEQVLTSWAKAHRLTGTGVSDWVKSPKVKSAILKVFVLFICPVYLFVCWFVCFGSTTRT
jgi:hypothetical protein